MLDRQLLALTKPATDAAARWFASLGVSANQVTLTGFVLGMMAAVLIVVDEPLWAVVPLALNRVMDGIDGAVARLATPTDRGAFLDISLDFVFYAAVPLAFALCNPAANALAAAVLLAAFLGTGTSFLAFAVMAEKRGEKSSAYPSKAFYYLGGLTEGSETIACFVLMCLWSEKFALIACVYAGLCAVTTATRLVAGWKMLGPRG